MALENDNPNDENYANGGRHPEEMQMMPKAGWSDEKRRLSHDARASRAETLCGYGSFRPAFLQKTRKMWLFALIAGLSSLFSEYLHLYMASQVPFLRRQYEMGPEVVDMLTLPSPIASLFTILFLSVVARRVHIPKALAYTSFIAGGCALFCIIPYIHSKCDLADAPVVLKNETYTMEGLLLDMPSCLLSRLPKGMMPKMMAIMADLDKKKAQKEMKTLTANSAEESTIPFGEGSATQAPQGTTIIIPDFEKLSQHSIYESLIPMAKTMGIDLEKVKVMNLEEQVEYMKKLPPHVRDMLPKLKAMLGPNPDDYFISYGGPELSKPGVTETPAESGTTIIMPDFEKLSKHPIYNSLKPMAKSMGIDIEKVRAMSLPEQVEYLKSLPPNVRAMLPNLKGMLGENPDQYFFSYSGPKATAAPAPVTEAPAESGTTLIMPDFEKLSKHPIYSSLVPMAKTMGIDLEKVKAMSLPEQVKYLKSLPPNVRAMLPNLKGMLGENPDQYFFSYSGPKATEAPVTEAPVTEAPAASGTTLIMPDFLKLSKHPIYGTLVPMAKTMGVDLEKLKTMTRPEQAEYIKALPDNVRAMLPNLKGMLGANPDQYFISYAGPDAGVTEVPTGGGTTYVMPDFEKLSKHSIYSSLVPMAMTMGVDLEKLRTMTKPEQVEYLKKLPPNVRAMLPTLKGMLGENPDQYFISYGGGSHAEVTTMPTGSGTTIEMPDFELLSQHSIYGTLVPMAKTMGIDLEKLRTMTKLEQAKYLTGLPPHLKAMLPNLKAMLGPNPDQYFITYELPKSRKKRFAKLYADMMYSGALSNIMRSRPPIPMEVHEKLFKELCPFNTEPFHKKDHSPMLLCLFVLAMICHGIAVAPRLAFVITFIDDNTNEMETGKHLGVFAAVSNIGALIAFMLGMSSMMTYITLEDTGYMTFLNPRWLPAWWMGFLILGLLSWGFSVPMCLFPKRMPAIKSPRRQDSDDEVCCFGLSAVKDLFSSLFRLTCNGVYFLILGGSTLSYIAWTGVTSILMNYVSSQFSLEPIVPGIMLNSGAAFMVLIGTIVGGFISSKMKWSPINCLKMVAILSFVLVVIHAANLGFGCDQPVVDDGLKIVKNASDKFMCSKTCVCTPLAYSPVCGSDGITYYSPCHAGCGDVFDGKFHDCKCMEDKEQTALPHMCQQNCHMHYAFYAAILIGGLTVGLRFVPLLLSSYRCVESRDIPAAIGLKMFFIILFGQIIGPHIYKKLEASACLLKRPECGIMPECAYFDLETYRVRIFVISLVFEAVGLLMILLAFLLGRKPTSKYNERVFDKDQVKG